jgi:hypothetical protein
MKKIILTALLLSVFLAGCTALGGGTGTGVASGVIVKSFGPDISELYPGDDVVFALTAENVGGEDATGVTAKLFGLSSDWIYQGDYQTSARSLTRAQPDVPGGSEDFIWTATAPTGLKREQTYDAMARLKYTYTTTALGELKIYNSNYLKTRPDQAQTVTKSSGLASFTSTQAPLTISITGAARPIIYRGTAGQTYTVSALIKNAGQGYPFTNTEDDMTITIESMTVAGADCTTDVAGTARIPRGGSKSLSCNFNVPAVSEYTTVPIEVVISYNYFVDSTASIKVLAEVV